MEKQKKKNIHKGHRERMRRKFIENDIEVYESHEVLELLLFYCYRQVNTNDIAHRLIDKFGSLRGVFDADIKSLMEVEGVGENAAVFLKLQGALLRYCEKNDMQNNALEKITPSNVGKFVKPLFYGYTEEVFYIICLDNECRRLSSDKLAKGTVNSTAVYSREVVKKALECKASFVIMAHNHPNGVLAPSEEDVQTTQIIKEALNFINVRLIDHVIVAGDKHVSLFKEYNIL